MYLKGVQMFGWLRGDWSESFIVHIEPRVKKADRMGEPAPNLTDASPNESSGFLFLNTIIYQLRPKAPQVVLKITMFIIS